MMKLSRRERYAVVLGGIVLAGFLVIKLIVMPYLDSRQQLQRTLRSKTETMEEMIALKAQVERLRNQAEQVKEQFANRPPGFKLYSFLDGLAGRAEIKRYISYIKPSNVDDKDSPYQISMVEMKLQGITLKQLIPYLHMVETSDNVVFIRRMSITKTGKDKEVIDAILQVETYDI